jgi:protein-S-isoprenylcysteine O-methyltransferase Ste14
MIPQVSEDLIRKTSQCHMPAPRLYPVNRSRPGEKWASSTATSGAAHRGRIRAVGGGQADRRFRVWSRAHVSGELQAGRRQSGLTVTAACLYCRSDHTIAVKMVQVMQLSRIASAGEVIGKAILVAVFGVFAALKALAIKSQLDSWEPGRVVEKYIELAAQFASLAFLVLLLSLTLLRFRPHGTAGGWEPRVSALVGTFLSLSLVALPMADLGPVLRVVAIALVLAGWLSSIYVLAWLGRSFSIMAQARRLVTRGPYRVVRHPLYVCEEIAMIGMVLLCLSPMAVLIAAVQWMFQLRRMTNEERVLRASFPEYVDYAARHRRSFHAYSAGGKR